MCKETAWMKSSGGGRVAKEAGRSKNCKKRRKELRRKNWLRTKS
jgi:hypothetical protein